MGKRTLAPGAGEVDDSNAKGLRSKLENFLRSKKALYFGTLRRRPSVKMGGGIEYKRYFLGVFGRQLVN